MKIPKDISWKWTSWPWNWFGNNKDLKIIKKISKNNNKGELALADIKIHYKTIVINIVVVEPEDRIEILEKDQYLYGNVIYGRGNITINTKSEQDTLFNKWCCDHLLFIWKRNTTSHHTQNNFMWIKYLKFIIQIWKLLEHG